MTPERRRKIEQMSERELLVHLVDRVEQITDSQIDLVTRVEQLEKVQALIGTPQ